MDNQNNNVMMYDGEDVMEVAVLAGHILLENGGEIFRVDDTIRRISTHYGVNTANAFILTNGILATSGSPEEHLYAKVLHVPMSGINLDKVTQVNQLSREITEGKYTLEEARAKLIEIRNSPPKRKSVRILAAGLGSGAFCYMFGGSFSDVLCAVLAGLILYFYILNFGAPKFSKIVCNLVGGLLVTLICGGLYMGHIGAHLNFMIIGSIMPMVPGVSFTNAIRDFADGDYISGVVRLMDAIVIFGSIAIGVGLGILLMRYLGGGVVL